MICIDVETTTYSSGSPFDRRNQLVAIAFREQGGQTCVLPNSPETIQKLSRALQKAPTIIGFNLKFDLHWLRLAGLDFQGCRVYDAQLAEYILSGQTHKFPSLDDVAFKYTGLRKIDKVKDLWDQGVQTTDIPWEVLAEYAAKDVDLTISVAEKQRDATPDSLKKLISVCNQDLLVLEEMEWNGIKFDRELSLEKAQDLALKTVELQGRHNFLHNIPNFNWGSNEHLSALLYGGQIKEPIKVPVGHFKSGQRVGQVKYKNDVRIHHLPRIYTPPKGAEKAKDGVYSVDEEALLSLSGKNKELISDLLELKKIRKEIDTYLEGLPKKQDEGGYTDYIYGNFNQCATFTGRLSSSSPNLQNLSEEAGRCLTTRF